MISKSVCTTVLLLVTIFPLRALGSIPVFWSIQAPQLSFEVATIKPATPGDRSGKFAVMQSGHQFVVRNYTVKDLVSFSYDLPPRRTSGGPAWTDIDAYNLLAATSGEAPPNLEEQMAMVRSLLDDRFQFRSHREQRELPVYELTVAKNA